ncbi:hypothetical protein [Gloeocapsopsis dulcis]|uniref:Methionine synthase n=1 Tax=Gloeocapsopsis dulcis AAB1 = 1H9 TaxID=1433147 RepID=A0A6N8FY85_9CHRO|nr:hypothetical protein [Gloeocapsopsis dulcis]MUL37295.1 hypothetical protein [Gloeocapsopsis dulcis AAB1 = 1H9]WNN91099.1 hypothetical protein P0S91_08490 [Gloeocapsopsis dulcis]
MSQELTLGVYFSANDVVYDWTIAFLNSFRTFNPDLRLILIPFNEQCDRLLQLQERYNFEVYIDPSFPRLEAIGQAFELGHTPTGPYWFRRYAAFWGPLNRFMYLDARQVVLADLKPFIEALDQFGFDFIHYDCAIDQVYEPGVFRQELLRQGRGRGFNSGRWATREGLFSLEEFEHLAAEALKIRDQLNPRNTDQAFINYCCDMKPVCYGHFAEVIGGICHTGWARQPRKIYQQDGKYYLWDYGGLDHKKQLFLLHWAGHPLNIFMPHRSVFCNFFFRNEPISQYLITYLYAVFEYLVNNPIEVMRKNRHINTLYHLVKRTISL